MIHVIATITCKTAQRAAVLAEFRQIIAPVRAEDGCIEYGPAIDCESGLGSQTLVGDDAFIVVEKWRDVAALQAHSVAPHMAAYRERVKDLVAGSQVQILDPADQV